MIDGRMLCKNLECTFQRAFTDFICLNRLLSISDVDLM